MPRLMVVATILAFASPALSDGTGEVATFHKNRFGISARSASVPTAARRGTTCGASGSLARQQHDDGACRWCCRSSATFANTASGGSRRSAVVVAQQATEAFATLDQRRRIHAEAVSGKA